jgi:nucleoporin NUP82
MADSSSLEKHPIFSLPKSINAQFNQSLELSTASVAEFERVDSSNVSAGRCNVMVVRDGDLIVAAGSEIRITPLVDARNGGAPKSYKARPSVYSFRFILKTITGFEHAQHPLQHS